MATHEELLVSMRCAPSKEGHHVYQAIDFLYQGKTTSEVSKLLHFNEKTIRNWIKRYNQLGITGLAYRGKSGRPRKIPIDKFQAVYIPLMLDPKLANEDNFTAIKFHNYLQSQHKEELCYQTLLNYFHEHKLSLVIPRPIVEGKQDQEKRAEFTRNITEIIIEARAWLVTDDNHFKSVPGLKVRKVLPRVE